MRNARLYMAVLAAVILCGGQMCRAQKITVDPNAGHASAAVNSDDTDSRLAQKISYEAWHTPIKTILADLSTRTGVTLISGFNKQDWQVRDRKMNIFVKDVTLAELMNSIARVMRFKWSKSEDTKPPTYRLYADRTLIAKLQVEATKRMNELKQERSKRVSGLLDQFEKLGKASPDEIEKLKKDKPYIYICAKTGFAELINQLVKEVPGLKDRFVSGDKNLIFPTAVLSPSTQRLYVDVIRKNDEYTHDGGPNNLPDDLESQLEKARLHFNIVPQPYEDWIRLQLSMLVAIGTQLPGRYYTAGFLRDPDSPGSNLEASAWIDSADGVKNTAQYNEQVSDQIQRGWRDSILEMEYYLMYDDVVQHNEPINPQTKISVKISDKARKAIQEQAKILDYEAFRRLRYQAIEQAVAEAAGLNVVSDSFAVVLDDYEPDGSEEELSKVLDKLCDVCKLNWDKHDSIIELRRRDWFRRRSSQIPDEWIQSWRDELNETGTLTLESYARMATLSAEQLEENITSDPLLEEALDRLWMAGNNEGILRLYLKLSQTQRAALFSEAGLDPLSLSPDQWAAYSVMFHYGRRYAWDTEAFTDPANGKAVMKAYYNVTPKGYPACQLSVSIETPNGPQKQTWTVILPQISRKK